MKDVYFMLMLVAAAMIIASWYLYPFMETLIDVKIAVWILLGSSACIVGFIIAWIRDDNKIER